jgi:hypothetical protein
VNEIYSFIMPFKVCNYSFQSQKVKVKFKYSRMKFTRLLCHLRYVIQRAGTRRRRRAKNQALGKLDEWVSHNTREDGRLLFASDFVSCCMRSGRRGGPSLNNSYSEAFQSLPEQPLRRLTQLVPFLTWRSAFLLSDALEETCLSVPSSSTASPNDLGSGSGGSGNSSNGLSSPLTSPVDPDDSPTDNVNRNLNDDRLDSLLSVCCEIYSPQGFFELRRRVMGFLRGFLSEEEREMKRRDRRRVRLN